MKSKSTAKDTRSLNEIMKEQTKKLIPAMTFDQVVDEIAMKLRNLTGLATRRVSKGDSTVEIHLLANGLDVGYTSVSKRYSGGYIVGGTAAGCFMGIDVDQPTVGRAAGKLFEELEERANKPKVGPFKTPALNDLYLAETPRERQDVLNSVTPSFQELLEFEFDMQMVSKEKRDKVYSLAWENGHSSGYMEVLNYYRDYIELVK